MTTISEGESTVAQHVEVAGAARAGSGIVRRGAAGAARAGRGAAAPVVPPVGPPWFGAVMGTGILSSLLQRAELGALSAIGAPVLLGLGWLLLLGLALGYLVRLRAGRTSLRQSVAAVADATAWGLVAVGVLSIGGATLATLPSLGAPTGLAVTLAAALWVAGTLLGLVTTLAFARRVPREPGEPTFTWGLPVVPPMVSATTGAALAAALTTSGVALAVLVVSAACFVLSLVVGGWIFAAAYRHHRRVPLPLAASVSAWIPLGIVGQSTAAAQGIAPETGRWSSPDVAELLRGLAVGYGAVVLLVGMPLVLWAVRRTVSGLAQGMPFSPGWWALTFPLGTLALGAGALGAGAGSAALVALGVALTLALVGTWTLCALATVRVLVAARR